MIPFSSHIIIWNQTLHKPSSTLKRQCSPYPPNTIGRRDRIPNKINLLGIRAWTCLRLNVREYKPIGRPGGRAGFWTQCRLLQKAVSTSIRGKPELRTTTRPCSCSQCGFRGPRHFLASRKRRVLQSSPPKLALRLGLRLRSLRPACSV